jgi:hypothetical protein
LRCRDISSSCDNQPSWPIFAAINGIDYGAV